jgi:hypothetical protein
MCAGEVAQSFPAQSTCEIFQPSAADRQGNFPNSLAGLAPAHNARVLPPHERQAVPSAAVASVVVGTERPIVNLKFEGAVQDDQNDDIRLDVEPACELVFSDIGGMKKDAGS